MTEYQKNELKAIFDKKRSTLAIAESLTSGLLQSYAASVSGSSTFYLGGITAYTIDAKAKFLGVDHAHATSVNAVSERVVKEMAEGVCSAFGSDVGVATTGFAEPSDDLGVEIPYAYIGVSMNGGDQIAIIKVTGGQLNRNEMRRHVADEAMKLLLEQVKGV